jgi:hypothetical protein
VLLMYQAALLESLPLDAFGVEQDGLAAPELNIDGREIVQSLLVARLIVVVDEGPDLRLEIVWQVVVLEQSEKDQQTVRGLFARGTFFTV